MTGAGGHGSGHSVLNDSVLNDSVLNEHHSEHSELASHGKQAVANQQAGSQATPLKAS